MYGNSMYGGGMGMGSSFGQMGGMGGLGMSGGMGMQGMNQNQQQMPQLDPNDPNYEEQKLQQENMQRQQEFRQNLQGTISGMNASVGLAGGMIQIGYLGSQAAKFTFLALKWLMGKIFNSKNVSQPLKFVSRQVLGTDFSEGSKINPQNLKYFEHAWKLQNNKPNDSWFSRILKHSAAVLKSLVFIAFGIAIAIVLRVYKQNKNNQLQHRELQEILLKEQRQKEMEHSWKLQQEKHRKPKTFIMENVQHDIFKRSIIEDSDDMLDDSNYELIDSHSVTDLDDQEPQLAFDTDLDLNEVNFNLIKNSNTFKNKPKSLKFTEDAKKTITEKLVDFDLNGQDGSTGSFIGNRRSEEDGFNWNPILN